MADGRGVAAGASITGVLFDTEYVDAMRVPNRWQTVEKMLAHPILSAGLAAIKQPILALDWHIEPGSKSDQDKEIARSIEEDLFDLDDLSWTDYLTEVLTYLDNGVAVFERVWEYRDDRLRLAALGPRPPKSIVYWHVTGSGRPDGFTQLLPTGSPERFHMTDILAFTFGRKGGFWIGTSVLRAAYQPWLVADKLTRVEAIAIERNGVGIPAVKITDATLKEDAEQMLMTIRGGEKNYALLVEGMEDFKIMGVDSGTIIPADPVIKRHELNMLRALGAEFVAMGGDASGSRAMHVDKVDFFTLRLNAVADYIAEVHNRHMLPDWVRANFGRIPTNRLPRLTHSRIDTRDVGGLATALAVLADKGLLTPDVGMENELRAMADLSPRSTQVVATPVSAPGTGAAAPMQLADAPRLESLVKLEALGVKVNFARMAKGLDGGRDKIVAASAATRKKQIQNLVMYARDVMRKPDPYKAIAEVQPRFVDDLAGDIEDDLDDLYDLGADEAWEELDGQGASPKRPSGDDGRKAIAGRALVIATMLGDKLVRAWAAEMLTQARSGTLDEAELRSMLDAVSDKDAAAWAGQAANEALDEGRSATIEANADHVDRLIYTAAMDQNTCGPCAELDGQEYSADDPDLPDLPNPQCEGGDLCRCVYVPVAA